MEILEYFARMFSFNEAPEKNTCFLLEFKIPLVSRRAVIGNRGSTVKNIARRNNVEIQSHRKLRSPWSLRFEKDSFDYAFKSHGMPNDYCVFENDVSVIVRGTEACCKRAQIEILQIVSEEKDKVFVEELKISYAKENLLFREISSLKKKYPSLYFDIRGDFRLKGDKRLVKMAQEELMKIQDRVDMETHEIQVRVPAVIKQHLSTEGIIELSGIIDENDVWVDLPEIEDDPNILTICGPEDAVKATESRISQTIEECVHHEIDASDLIPGDLTHVRVVLMIVKFKLETLANRNDVSIKMPRIPELEDIPNTSYIIEIFGKPGDVETYEKEVATLVGRITPEKVAVFSNCDPEPALDDMSIELMRFERENDVRIVFLDGNMYVIDKALAKGNVECEKELVSRLAGIETILSEWREIMDTLDKVTLSVPFRLQKYLLGPGCTTRSCLIDLLEGQHGDILFHHNERKDSENEIHIQGPKEAVQKIIEAIGQILEDLEETGDYRLYESRISVPSSVVSGLIGKNRRFWRELKHTNCVGVRVLDQEKGTRGKESNVVIAVSGIELNVKRAVKQILGKAEKHVSRVEINRAFLKRIAGPGYVSVKRIETEFDVEMRFFRVGLSYPCPRNPDEILILGRKSNVKGATRKVIELYEQERRLACERQT